MARSGAGVGDVRLIDAVFWLVGAAIVGTTAWAMWRAWDDATASTYRLRKDQWTCSASRTYATSTREGRLGRSFTTHRTVCNQYTRVGGGAPAQGVYCDPTASPFNCGR